MMKKSKQITLAMVLLVASVSLPIHQASANSFPVSTLSGTGGAGIFNNPSGVSVSPDGAIYVADKKNFQVKKIVGDNISVFATAPNAASALLSNSFSTQDSFCSVYVKSLNEIFVSDCINSLVYKYANTGQLLRTYKMNFPLQNRYYDWGGGLAVDLNGGIFLSDEWNRLILRIDEFTGNTTIYAGLQGKSGSADGDVSTAMFNLPRGLAVDSKGNLLVADAGLSRIRKISPQRVTSTYSDNVPTALGVAVDSQDSIFAVSERWAGSIIHKIGSGRIFDDSPRSVTSSVNGAVSGQLSFSGGSGISIDRFGASPSNNIFIADEINHAVKVYSSDGKNVRRWGSQDGFGVTNVGTTNQIYDFPSQSFPLDNGSYLVVDNFTIRHIASGGEVLKTTRLTQGCFFSSGVAITPDGTFFCTVGKQIMARFIDGTWTTIGQGISGRKDGRSDVAQFGLAEGVATYKDDLYVADRTNQQIRKISRIAGTKSFEVTTVLGTGLQAIPTDIQQWDKATFQWPCQIAIDGLGNLYIADGGVSSIFKTSILQKNDVTRIASWKSTWPTSMTVDRDNNVYVSTEAGGIFLVKGNVMTYLGGRGTGNDEGSLVNSKFNIPTGLSIDIEGNLIVADRDNQKFKKVYFGVPGLKIYDSKILATYLKPSEPSIPSNIGLSSAQELILEKAAITNNEIGLIAKTYKSADVQTPARSITGLPLCEVKIEKSINFDWGNSPVSSANGCSGQSYIATFTGFITWPGSAKKESRSLSVSVDDGVYLKINNNVVIDHWKGSVANPVWPWNKSEFALLEGGKQYPIEIWYYAWKPPSSLKLYWSSGLSRKDTDTLIEPIFLSPKLKQVSSAPVITKPAKPASPEVTINLNLVNLSVTVPTTVSSVVLFAPEFGVSKLNPIIGQLKDGKANFEMSLSSKFAGKKGALQIVSRNSAGDSDPLKIPVTAPKAQTKPAPIKTNAPKPQAAPKLPEVTCLKGATKRTFEGTTCPPGYTNG